MTNQTYWGIDVSKDSLDVCVEQEGNVLLEMKIENQPSKIRMAVSSCMAKLNLNWSDCVFCMESTGIYTAFLLRYLASQTGHVFVVNPVHLKRSLGLARGKNDKIDARRIARFIAKNYCDLIRYSQPHDDVVALKALQTKRQMYIKQQKQLNSFTSEQKKFGSKEVAMLFSKVETPILKTIKKAIKEIDLAISMIINRNVQLKTNCKLIQTVPGVGPILALGIAVATKGFTRLLDSKQLACYAGVVPFEHSSGTSVRGRSRVSQMADKSLKTILHLAALRITQLPGELREYYLRKVAQGKNKMLVLNSIRNKIIRRVLAVLKSGRCYQPDLVLS